MNFSLGNLNPWKKKAIEQVTRDRREIILRLFRAVVFDTPVLEGTLRGNWQCSMLSPITGPISKRVGNQVMAEIQSVLNGSKLEDTIYLRNNMPYAYGIEYYGWSKVKAPQGMVRKNIMRLDRIAASVARSSRL